MNLLVGGSERRSSLKLVEDKRFSSPCKDFPPEVTVPTALNGVQILVNPEEIKGSPRIGPTQQVFDLLVPAGLGIVGNEPLDNVWDGRAYFTLV